MAKLVKQITEAFQRRWPSGGTIHIEAIQDQVELSLMRAEEYKAAKAYVLYREERRQARLQEQAQQASAEGGSLATVGLQVQLDDGKIVPLDAGRLNDIVQAACQGLDDVEVQVITKDTQRNIYDGGFSRLILFSTH